MWSTRVAMPAVCARMLSVHLFFTPSSSSTSTSAEMTESGVVADVRKEPGNLKYEYFFPMDDPETVLLIDRWEDQAAIDAHHKSEMMGRIAALRDKYRLRMRVERYQAL